MNDIPMQQAGLAARLDNALLWRTEQAGLAIEAVAGALGMAPAELADKRAGRAPVLFSDIEALDEHFAAIGFPGLIDEVRTPRGWTARPLPMSSASGNEIVGRLLGLAPKIRQAGAALPEFLGDNGLLSYVHIMIRTDDAIRTVHCGGAAMANAINVDRSILGRDVRSLNDRAYGQFLHTHVSELLRRGKPDLCRITSPALRYSRFSIPAGVMFVAYSFDVEVTESFVLR